MWNFAQTLDHKQQKLEDCGYEGKNQALGEKKDWILFCYCPNLWLRVWVLNYCMILMYGIQRKLAFISECYPQESILGVSLTSLHNSQHRRKSDYIIAGACDMLVEKVWKLNFAKKDTQIP